MYIRVRGVQVGGDHIEGVTIWTGNKVVPVVRSVLLRVVRGRVVRVVRGRLVRVVRGMVVRGRWLSGRWFHIRRRIQDGDRILCGCVGV